MTDLTDDRKRYTLLIVDDSPDNVDLLTSRLKGLYRTKVATNGHKALQIAFSEEPPDLILLDVMMPGIDGYEVCRRLKEEPKTREIPVIFLTGMDQAEDEQRGFETGAVDYITKPSSSRIVLARVATHLQLKSARDFLKDKSEYLEQEVERRTREVNSIQDVTMVAMGSLAEARDNETGNHIRRTQSYVRLLAVKLKSHPRFKRALSDETIALLFKSAPLHDIGKVGIPDHILLKPAGLTPEEFEIMKTHTVIGRDAILASEKLLHTPSSFLRIGREISYSHHEKWDGSGYTEGLSGDDIPLSGRLMALADVYDALISRRVYKPAFSHSAAVSIIRNGFGSHFDPSMFDAFQEVAEQFYRISQRFADSPTGGGR